MAHPNVARLQEFYAAFNRKEGAAMGTLYAPEATFSDPAFPGLVGKEVPGMWASLCEGATDLRVELIDVSADDTAGAARWEAWYTFSLTKKKVHNVISARFTFRDGLVVAHEDHFDFWRWSRQALGLPGWFLGWSSFLRKKVQSQARKNLMRWLEKRG